MSRNNNGQWNGRPEEKAVSSSSKGSLQPLYAVLMIIVGIGLTMAIDEVRTAVGSHSFVTVTYEQGVYEEVQSVAAVESGTAATDITQSGTTSTDDGVDPLDEISDYQNMFDGVDVKAIAYKAAAEAKYAADEEYRSEMANARVVSSNSDLYLDGYSYGAPANLISESYTGLNSDGIAMSQYVVPDDVKIDANGVPEYYSYYIDGVSTAYCDDGYTATGTRTHQGTVAVDPREIPYGTEMWITSSDGKYVYGYCRAEDTGGFIYYSNGATVDLFMHSYNDCLNWGRTSVRIYILSK